jgi:hypothetical protein
MRRWAGVLAITCGGLVLGLSAPARADNKCPGDSVRAGPACVDKYEASVWETTNAQVVKKIRKGTVTLQDLLAAGAVQHGATVDDYGAGCPDTGNGCKDFYAVSIPGVPPSRFITYFQALATLRNSVKRLPTNQEWQAAAFGTPDGAPCIVSAAGPGLTGTPGCVSDVGAFDMVGNVWEWVGEWVPRSNACPVGWGGFSDDHMCLAGADTNVGGILRGGQFGMGTAAGVFAVDGTSPPQDQSGDHGFRGVR